MDTNKHQKLLHKKLSYEIQGAAIEVRKNFGSGLKETIYQKAFAEELKARNIKFEKEKSIQIFSPKTSNLVGSYRPDFIAEDKILIELKAVEKIPKMFLDRLFSYLRNSKYELGYFINFASPKLYMKRLIFTNDRKFKLKNLLVALSFIFVFLSVLPAEAAQLYFGAQGKQIGIGKKFEVGVFINTQGEKINAIEGKITFPQNTLALQSIEDGGSLINFWIERPSLTSKSYILYSGIIPGGYMGNKGLLFSLVFQARAKGNVVITSKEERVLLNDGRGSQAPFKRAPITLVVAEKTNVPEYFYVHDATPPEAFTPLVTRDISVFGGKYFLAFATQDKGSGIDHYEIRESRKWKMENRNWVLAESPYVLKDQELRSYIYVKALDKAGNERIALVEPRYPIRWYEVWWIWSTIIIIVASVTYAIKKLKTKNEKGKSTIGN